MQFIKKNYEKILLGLVLVGLVVVAVLLLLKVSSEKQAQQDRRTMIINRPVKPLPAMEMDQADALLKRAESPLVLSFSDNTHKLFNPVRWQKTTDGKLLKNPVGTDIQKLELTKPTTPLYFNITLDSVNTSETGMRFGLTIEQQAALKPTFRGRRPYYVSKGDKREYGENKQTFTLSDVAGAPENPDCILELSDLEKPITVSKEKPFHRVDGYMADLRFTPENRTYPNRRVGDTITVAGEQYNIVAIAENEVVLSAKSNQKKWTIKYNPAP